MRRCSYFMIVMVACLMIACKGDQAERMRHDMEQAEAQNKAYEPFTTDSVALAFTCYYDRYGSANERLKAHYLLGCAYRDLGESPRAIDYFMDALAAADTTASDCDFHTMAAVCSQMASVFHRQLLLTKEIEVLQKARHFNLLAKDTLNAINSMKMAVGAYILQNKTDSAERLMLHVMDLYREHDYRQAALQASTILMYLYAELPDKQDDLKALIDDYDAHSNIFDEHHELPPTKRMFYYYKGKHFENIHRLDSAETYYRKLYHPETSFTQKNPMYRGLLSVFQKRHISDSIAKYALLYCAANDSSIALKDQELTAQMAASYNYSSLQKQVAASSRRMSQAIATIGILILLMIISLYFWVRKRRQQQEQLNMKQQELDQLQAEYASAIDTYQKNQSMLQLLDLSHQKVVEHLQKESDERLQHELLQLQRQQEVTKQELSEENAALIARIHKYEQQERMSLSVRHFNKFLESPIIERVLDASLRSIPALPDEDWSLLHDAFSNHFPQLLSDLSEMPKSTPQKMRMCMLIILGLRDSCIANWLNVKPSRLSNMKAELNQEMFGDSSARSLHNNLRKKYQIMG